VLHIERILFSHKRMIDQASLLGGWADIIIDKVVYSIDVKMF